MEENNCETLKPSTTPRLLLTTDEGLSLQEFLTESESLTHDDDSLPGSGRETPNAGYSTPFGRSTPNPDNFNSTSLGRLTPNVDYPMPFGRFTPMEFFPCNGRITPSGYVTPCLTTPMASGRATPYSDCKTSFNGRITPLYPFSPLTLRKQIIVNDCQIKASNDAGVRNRVQNRVEGTDDDSLDKETLRRLDAGEDLYPNCDITIWLRSCKVEVVEPMQGKITGCVPEWLKGTLIRNGPGSLEVGDMTFDHLFDSSALLHRFAISEGKVTYQNRFLKSETYKRNQAAQRIVVTEFGTKAVPDPCQSIFQRVSALFHPGESMSDNAMISVYPFGDEFYTFTEAPIIHRIDPKTLDTLERINVSDYVGIVNHTSHPHVMKDGTVYNMGLSVTATGPTYTIIKFPTPLSLDNSNPGERVSSFEQATVVGGVRVRWPLHPAYMHTFGITDNYFIIVEQPLSVSVAHMVKNQLKNEPMATSLRWYKDKQLWPLFYNLNEVKVRQESEPMQNAMLKHSELLSKHNNHFQYAGGTEEHIPEQSRLASTLIHLMNREDGKLYKTFYSEAFFYLHIINQYEDDGHVVIDICCYKDAAMLDCMYIDSLKGAQQNPDYARMFRGRPLRFVLPLHPATGVCPNVNLVTLAGTRATANKIPSGHVTVTPEVLCDLGCETPRINYEKYLGKVYRYFYAISSDVDMENPGTLIKVDIANKSRKTWCEENVFPSEPIFVSSPHPKSEDDGVVLAALIWGQGMDNQVGLLILDATTWTEVARARFTTPSAVPKCLHGWFTGAVH